MNVKQRRLIVIPLVLLVLLAAYVSRGLWWPAGSDNGDAGLVLYGNVDQREVNLAFLVSGRIDKLMVREGEHIRQGQLLASLDAAHLEYAMEAARAHVDAQAQVLAALRAGTRPEDIRKLEADRDAAAATLRNAEASLRRIDDLARRKLASPQQRDDARTAVDAAHARLKAAEEALALGVAGPRKEDIAAAQATLEALQAQYALAQRNLADSKLHSPSDGIIRTRILEVGDMASPQTPVYTIALTNPIWVRAYIDEPDLGHIHPGMVATIHTDSYPGKTYRGWVGYISPTAEFTPKSVETPEVRSDLVYQVRVFVCNPRDELRLGMPATVTLTPTAANHSTSAGTTDGASMRMPDCSPDAASVVLDKSD